MLKNKIKRSRKSIAFAGLGLASLGLLITGVLGTGAFFTDTQTLGGNTFTTGTVVLSTNPTTAAITLTNMAPGDVQYGEVNVVNGGSLELRYAVTQAATNTDSKNLAGALNMQVKTGLANCTAAGWTGGTPLNGTANTFAAATVFGSPTAGNQAGDRVLAAGASEKLCFRVELPTSAGNTLQGATTTGTLTFTGEQTKNN